MVTSRFHVKPTRERQNVQNKDAGGRRRPGYEASPSCSIISSLLAAASAAVSLIWANLSAVRASSRRLLTFCTRSSCFLERPHFTALLWLRNTLEPNCDFRGRRPTWCRRRSLRKLCRAAASCWATRRGSSPRPLSAGRWRGRGWCAGRWRWRRGAFCLNSRVRLLIRARGIQVWLQHIVSPTTRGLASPCRPFGRSIDFISSSAMSNAFNPLSFRSQNSCRSKRPAPNQSVLENSYGGRFSSLSYLPGLVHSLLRVRLHLVVGMICYLGDRLLEDGRRLPNWQRCV